MAEERYHQEYRFGPIERRGLAGGLRPGQVLVLGCACLLGVAIFRRLPSAGGLALALLVVLVACLSVWFGPAGRQLDEWAPVVASWLWLRARREQRWTSGRPETGTSVCLGHRATKTPPTPPHPSLGEVEVSSAPLSDEREVGVLVDRRQNTRTAVLALRVRSFGLLAASEQERRLTRWGQTLASVARDGGVVKRVQILERTLPHDDDQLRSWLDSHAIDDIPDDSAIRRSYDGLLRNASDVTQDHEVLVAIQIDPRRSRTSGDRTLTAEAHANSLLVREVRALAERLDGSDAGVVGVCDPVECARVVATALDPFSRHRPGALAGPTATEVSWDRFRIEGAVHRTYWVAQWPRLAVGPAFLGPVLLSQAAVRTFSVVIEPVPPSRSRSAVEAAITSDEADEQLRRERGFRTTARRRGQQAATRRRETELSEGHEELRFAGYLTVSGRNDGELDRHCDEMLQAAQQAYLDLQPMWGQQDTSFAAGALPYCHGLARGRVLS